MGVIQTDAWMDEHFFNPLELCNLASPDVENHAQYYQYLRRFGMYQPSRRTYEMFTRLKEQEAWQHVEKYYKKYKKLWKGPDVDIYIFPIEPTRQFMLEMKGRSGLTFPDKIFLFLSPVDDVKIWESLLVHEYHHAARMNRYNKDPEDYNLLDSLIFEGLAEHAVQKYCGKEYTADWMRLYERDHLQHYWNRVYKERLQLSKKHPFHDDLLFGRKGIPRMMGYALGADIIMGYEGKHPLTVQESFNIPSEKILLDKNTYYGETEQASE
ncbi:MAG TPA: hypothetical protein DEO65_09855 [Bacillus bacterium]|uniref:DUF2268 domain-containing protein n=1 Tax=Siminovitchia fordii TaxID=254759 RepID=A0ABQ4K0E9_9BACI|nr:DUF2268 domain-containing putative Zn-dependent protease [Siminovitchia fordii]GIN19231.1 hypothetical protein J1TS3_03650 [Siminovitchia fordii]HBZ10167.1 hypothetical protein [Bacillus sp. (in: firmicutes)]